VTAAIDTSLLALVVYGAVLLATSGTLWAVWPSLGGRVQRAAPARRGRIALALAVAPTALPALVVLLTLLPGVAALVGLGTDHCTRHADHPHLCLVHPMAVGTPALLAAGAVVLAVLLVVATRQLRALHSAARSVARMRRAPGRPLEPGVREIASERPFSLTAGHWRPDVLVSTALTSALTPRQLEAVLAHERTHRRRRDPLRRTLAGLLSAPLPGPVRREVLATLDLAAEQVCDEEAARAVDDRLLVAEALLAVARLGGSARSPAPAPAPVTGFANGPVEARVRVLLGPPRPVREPAVLGWAAAFVVLAWACANGVHHTVEHLLQLALHLH
jgi:Zn-dependent protease with chaperone function